MPRFFLPPAQIDGPHFRLTGSEAHHAIAVHRLGVGDSIDLFDGQDRAFVGRIFSIEGGEISGILEEASARSAEKEPVVHLYAGLIKGPRWDWLVQKACEVGVDTLFPVLSRRSVVRFDDFPAAKLERWSRISLEAAKQCGRSRAMRIEPPSAFVQRVSATPADWQLLIPWEKARSGSLREACRSAGPKPVVLCIGPEGGWETDEVSLAQAKGAIPVSLGPWLLRSETAAVVAAAEALQSMRESIRAR